MISRMLSSQFNNVQNLGQSHQTTTPLKQMKNDTVQFSGNKAQKAIRSASQARKNVWFNLTKQKPEPKLPDTNLNDIKNKLSQSKDVIKECHETIE